MDYGIWNMDNALCLCYNLKGVFMINNTQKLMAKNLLEASKDKVNRNIKDSVFCNLFGKSEYLIQLYRAIHPEDDEIQEDDLTIITLSRIVMKEMYNDLGFLAGSRLVVLVEAQSTWSVNIVVRFLTYIGETYRRYIEQTKLNVYSSRKIELPKPELYVIYTGARKNRAETISLKKDIFQADESCVEVEAKVIFDSRQGDIINQFITFSKVFDSQRRLNPEDPHEAVRETIRICKSQDVLKDYLEQEEAATIMFTIADQEKAFQFALEEERQEGIKEGLERGKMERDQIVQERDQIVQERDQIVQERDQIVQERDQIVQERDQAFARIEELERQLREARV